MLDVLPRKSKYEKCNQKNEKKKIIRTINYNTRKGMLFEKFRKIAMKRNADKFLIYYTNVAGARKFISFCFDAELKEDFLEFLHT